MKTSICTMVLGGLVAVTCIAGCGGDRAKEFFEEQERQEREATEGKPSRPTGPEVDLNTLLRPKPKLDDSIPPPKYVDTRELRENHANGTVSVARSVKFFSDGSSVNHGPYTEWHPNGKKYLEGRYEDGKREGEWTSYWEDGAKAKSGTYKNGLPDGAWTYWDEQGKKKREEHYVKGDQDGEYTEWYPDGKLKAQMHFKQGKPDGKAVTWNEQGQKTVERVYRNGVLVDQVSSSGQK